MNRLRSFIISVVFLMAFVPVRILAVINNNSLAMNSFAYPKLTSRSTFSSIMSTVLGGAVSSAQGRIRGKISSTISLGQDMSVTGTRG